MGYKKELADELRQELVELKALSSHIDMLCDLGFQIDGKALEPILRAFDKWLDVVSVYHFGPESEDMSYFVYDLDFGRTPGKVGIEDREYILKDIESMIEYYIKEFLGG